MINNNNNNNRMKFVSFITFLLFLYRLTEVKGIALFTFCCLFEIIVAFSIVSSFNSLHFVNSFSSFCCLRYIQLSSLKIFERFKTRIDEHRISTTTKKNGEIQTKRGKNLTSLILFNINMKR